MVLEGIFGVLMLARCALTANEAAVASRVPLKDVHRIIDADLLAGAVEIRRVTRLLGGPGLLALKLAYVTADVLKPEARRQAVMHVLNEPGNPTFREQAVTVELGGIEAELEEGLVELEAAKAMVAVDSEILSGTPCFAGTRVPVHDVADMLSNGDTVTGLLQAYPALDERRIRLASVYAAAYPRRGRPPKPHWRSGKPASSEAVRFEDLPAT